MSVQPQHAGSPPHGSSPARHVQSPGSSTGRPRPACRGRTGRRCRTIEIPLASIGPAARLSREALVSFSYNFQNVKTIEKTLANHGIRDVFGGYPGLRDAMVALIAARHDLVHTSIPVRFNMRASYDAVVGLAFGIARHLPELEADMRLAEGDRFYSKFDKMAAA